jgi:hypothetical protein
VASNFPTSLDNFTNPSSGNTLDSPSHSLQHSDINDAVEALEAKLGIGASPAGSASAGQVLTISAAGTSTWAAPTGKILQIVAGSTTTSTSSSSSSYADTSLTASITPSSISSKVLVILNQASLARITNITGVNLKLFRGATELAFFQQEAAYLSTGATTSISGGAGIAYLDTPATISSVTYKTQFASQNNNSSVIVQYGSAMSTIILMEVAV